MAVKLRKKIAALQSFGVTALILLVVAVVLGGGGSHSPLKNLAVELVALAVLCLFVGRHPTTRSKFGLGLTLLLTAIVAIPLSHLVPLPAGLWQNLPGRDLALEARDLVGAGSDWFPLSLDRARTAGALAALLVPLAFLAAVKTESADARSGILAVVVLIGLANFFLGGMQVLLGNVSILGYPSLVDGRLYGFFANHNTSGLFFVLAICALGALWLAGEIRSRAWLSALAALVLVLGVVLTQSRSSLAIMALALLALAGMAAIRYRSLITARVAKVGGIVALVLASLAALAATNERIGQTLERFEALEDARPAFWADTRVAIDRYWPVGSGTGTFDEVFQVDESLETMTAAKAGRAHSDYLELMLESGVSGLIVLLCTFIWLGRTWWCNRGGGNRAMVDGAALALMCIALQSIIDYPLRNLAMLCLAACFVAVLAGNPAERRGRKLV